jgi:hypothetical protein
VGNYLVKDVMLSAWKERASQQIEIESNAPSGVEAILMCLNGFGSRWSPDIPEIFREYFVCRLELLRAGEFNSPKEIIEDLAYWIDFRTPSCGAT